MKKIKFHSSRLYNSKIKDLAPSPSKQDLPEWWKNASIFWKNDNGDVHVISEDETGKKERALGFKACPALMDIFNAGYLLKTPVDMMFVQYDGFPYVIINDIEYKDFCSERDNMGEFETPFGYHKKHFHWWPNWGIEVPKGYSLLVTSPLNRFDLPFLTVSGIIDSDRHTTSGLIPFFLKDGFSGLVKKGTPFAQVIPIKREEWASEYLYHDQDSITKRFNDSADKYRRPYGGIYKKDTWEKKKYE